MQNEKIIDLGEFETTRSSTSETIKFSIQTVPKTLKQKVIDHMTKYFLTREALCVPTKLSEDPDSVESIQAFFELAIDQGTALVALLKKTEESEPVIIGANMTYVDTKESKHDLEMFKGVAFKLALTVVIEFSKEANVFNKFNVDKFLSATGLSVHPDYHGFQIGEKLLRCREPLCKQLGLTVTGTLFTSPISQHLAERVGFETVIERDYSEVYVDGVAYWLCLTGDKIRYCVLKFD